MSIISTLRSTPLRFKIALVGNEGVGKTSFIRKLQNNNFIENYNPTLGVEVNSLPIRHSSNIFNIWDCAGQERFKGLGSGYYINASAAIIMIDNNTSYENITLWYEKIHSRCPNIPIVICRNKVDIDNNQIEGLEEFCEQHNYQHFNMSVKNNQGLHNPFNYLKNALSR